jgi:hypothetical protein
MVLDRLKDLIQVMGNEDNGSAVITDSLHMLVELFTAFLGKCGRGLIDNDNLGFKIGRLYNLDKLTILEIVIINHDIGLDFIKAVFLQKLVSLPGSWLWYSGCRP